MTIVTIRDINIAISKCLNLARDEAERYAQTVIDFFGFEDRIIDNMLTQEERQMFYHLHEKGIVSAQREEITLSTGQPWRIHYWCLERKFIFKLSHEETLQQQRQKIPLVTSPTRYEELYSSVPSDLWGTRKRFTT
ncbi:MAG: hypothetical protein NT038_03960 [Euryarchaeota archaeon]|nr:hypothetical protein [Euryarchaeota archaeon]